jgi:tripartite-type tricarboxylate transporter receptor subunit TctC
MLNRILFRLMIVLAALPACAGTSPARADFYQGKTITVVTSTGPGGTYDLTARLIARYMPRHIPGQPAMIVQNMPGGGNILATNFMYNIAPKDGTTIATIHSAMPLHQVLDGRGVRYDVGKFNWLGSTGAENELILVWHTAGIKTIQDAVEREVVVGGTGAASGIVIIPRAMNHLLGTKFKIVTGYKTSEDINVAISAARCRHARSAWALSSLSTPTGSRRRRSRLSRRRGAAGPRSSRMYRC